MKFVLDAEQRMFGETLHKLLAEADTPGLIRRWATGSPDRTLWTALAETGVFALAVPERHGGAGPLPVELVVAMHQIGRHAVPGPYVEMIAAAALLAGVCDKAGMLTGERPSGGGDPGGGAAVQPPDETRAREPSGGVAGEPAATWLSRIASGEAVVSLVPPLPSGSVPRRALDTDLADLVLLVDGDVLRSAATGGGPTDSLDPARRLFPVTPGTRLDAGAPVRRAAAEAYDLGALACAAQLLGLGRALLDVTVEYARTRRQFGRPIGEFQAVKHRLADALIGLEFARPLLYGAALSFGSPDFPRDVSAAKAAASEAAYATARTALQVHGAIGYTDEYAPSLWIRKIRALYSAWGSPSDHRARVLATLT